MPFGGTPGRWNAITDVPGVEVGYQTIIRGDTARTGVTGIHPRGRGGALDPLAAGYAAQNGNGEMTGAAWVQESGTTSLPIALTNTHAVGIAHAGIIAWAVRHYPELGDNWSLPVAAETWDGYLNDINGQHVTEADCVAALDAARSGPLTEGAVGGGTGMICYGFKGGSGTASRLVSHAGTSYTVGVFVQANFGARGELVLAGRPLGELLADDDPLQRVPGRAARCGLGHRHRADRRAAAAASVLGAGPPGHPRAGPHRDRPGRTPPVTCSWPARPRTRAAQPVRGPGHSQALRPAVVRAVGRHRPVLHRGGAGHRGSGGQCAVRR